MTILPGNIITATDLAAIWSGVELIYNTREEAFETHVVELDWTGATYSVDTRRIWVPPADAQVLAIVATTLGNGSIVGNVAIEITGNVTITGAKYLIPVASTPRRINLLANQPRVKVGAGDALFFRDLVTEDATSAAQFRIHILYQTRWGAL